MKIYVVLVFLLKTVQSAKILAFFSFPSISHQYVFQEIARGLSGRGHEVTFISPNPMNDAELKNFIEIDVSVAYQVFQRVNLSILSSEKASFRDISVLMQEFSDLVFEYEINNEDVKKILKKPSDAYDLILIESHNLVCYGLQHKFKAPLISVSSLNVYSVLHNMFGNTAHPILFPDLLSDMIGPIMSLRDKFDSVYMYCVAWTMARFYNFPKSDELARNYFGNDMPYIYDLLKNASLLMVNVNPVLSDRRPNVPNIIEFFNVHLTRNTSKVPVDLQEILDNAKEGVVYFSLGTNVRFDHVQGNIKESILQALGELPYTVLCKWESEDYPGKPKNVILKTWFPQQSILAHPNVKLFVTQGGLQSSEEAITNGVPLVVIPFLGDQPMNAKILTTHGMAETIAPKDLNKDILRDTILKVLKNEKYRQRAQELRDIFLDQPQSGIDKIIWWCEYVIRHKGAKHLRSPSADIPLYEYFMLDVLAVILIALFVIYKTLSITIRKILQLIRNKKSDSNGTEKKNR